MSPSLHEFLAEVKGHAASLTSKNEATSRPVHVVFGNEAADLDSVSCALALAFARHYADTQGTTNTVYLPVINIPRRELYLRKDIEWLLKKLSIDVGQLVFADEVDWNGLREGQLQVTMVDHNLLSPMQECLADHVHEIIDHHHDEDFYPGAKRTIEKVASCATLVANELLQTPASEDLTISELLLCAILIDSNNLNWAKGRVTQSDVETARVLMAKLPDLNTKKRHKRLKKLKTDLEGLTVDELVRRDYKQISSPVSMGFSSIGTSMDSVVSRNPDTMSTQLAAFMKEKGIVILVLLTKAAKKVGGKREIALIGQNGELVEGLSEGLTGDSTLALSPMLLPAANLGPHSAAYTNEVNASRKEVLPLIRQILTQQLKETRHLEIVSDAPSDSSANDDSRPASPTASMERLDMVVGKNEMLDVPKTVHYR